MGTWPRMAWVDGVCGRLVRLRFSLDGVVKCEWLASPRPDRYIAALFTGELWRAGLVTSPISSNCRYERVVLTPSKQPQQRPFHPSGSGHARRRGCTALAEAEHQDRAALTASCVRIGGSSGETSEASRPAAAAASRGCRREGVGGWDTARTCPAASTVRLLDAVRGQHQSHPRVTTGGAQSAEPNLLPASAPHQRNVARKTRRGALDRLRRASVPGVDWRGLARRPVGWQLRPSALSVEGLSQAHWRLRQRARPHEFHARQVRRWGRG